MRGCAICGSARVAPLPGEQSADELYTESYYEEYIAGAGMAGGVSTASPALRARLDALERQMQPGRIVDLGSALGTFVAYAKARGWDALGIEPSIWAAEEARRRYGIEVHSATLESAPIPPASVDVVHANHVIEHLTDPLSTLAAALRILKPRGLLVIEVPQELRRPLADRVFGRLHPELYRRPSPSPTYHVTFFTVHGLASLARRAGFVIESARTVRHLRSTESRFPLGVAAKEALYALEERLQSSPDIELVGVRPTTS